MDYAITIKPQYVAAIMFGSKRCEIRTRVPKGLGGGDEIYVIEAGTGGEVMLHLLVAEVWCGKPDDMFKILGYKMAISRADYEKYVAGREVVYIITFIVIQEGRPLMHLADLGLKKAPQWFTKVTCYNGKGGVK